MNGSISINETTFGSTISFSCDEGFDLTGSVIRECQDNGLWNRTQTMCTRKTLIHIKTLLMKQIKTAISTISFFILVQLLIVVCYLLLLMDLLQYLGQRSSQLAYLLVTKDLTNQDHH